MFLGALLLLIAAPRAQAAVPETRAITVTGHAWAPFISPMGEPYRARSATDDTLSDWFAKADSNHDALLTPCELEADADRFFSILDTNGDGQIDPDELATYEWQVAPEIQAMARTRRAPGQPDESERHKGRSRDPSAGRNASTDTSLALDGALQGAARYGLLNIPEPVAAADTNFDRGISREEFRQAALYRFGLLDPKRSGKLTLVELQTLRSALLTAAPRKRDGEFLDNRIANRLPSGR
jgi:hypothetical protein